ncbi:MAG TPA: class I SAM-dependent methyltransferase [Tepidisphaeraceae bacterium]|jgi:SAM-dependent methyltransferase|nr:class I SAM-dependent methyltransferase [Tepidisphaeraceae bacterium]
MPSKDHWEFIYSTKQDDQLSWAQPIPTLSLALIRELLPIPSLIDIGGGASPLIDHLLDDKIPHLAVLDISQAALTRSQTRLGPRQHLIRWIVADITTIHDLGHFDLWHDRAVFHFLTNPDDRHKYITLAQRTVIPGGHLIIATFAPDAPDKCSGLPVQRYDAQTLAAEFAPSFTLKKQATETHLTPWGKPQQFAYAVLQRVNQ